MERIRVFKVLKGLSKSFIVFGSIITLVAFYVVIKSLFNGFNTKFPSGDWTFVFFTIQGLLFILMGSLNLIKKKYFIEWDDRELRFLLPDTKQVETVLFSEIVSVNIKLFEIELKIKDTIRTLNLDNMEFEDLKRVKKKFEDLRVISK